jgi:hypothetical protein
VKLLVARDTRNILDASDFAIWEPLEFAAVFDHPGNVDSFVWPHPLGASSCRLVSGAVVANASVAVPPEEVSTEDLIAALEKKALLTREDVETAKEETQNPGKG